MTIEQLYDIIKIQQDEIKVLKEQVAYLTADLHDLRKWSDDNDYWLREMIDALTESVDGIMDDHCGCKKYQRHRSERVAKKWHDYNCACAENREGI